MLTSLFNFVIIKLLTQSRNEIYKHYIQYLNNLYCLPDIAKPHREGGQPKVHPEMMRPAGWVGG